jgi:hypothetical protein
VIIFNRFVRCDGKRLAASASLVKLEIEGLHTLDLLGPNCPASVNHGEVNASGCPKRVFINININISFILKRYHYGINENK